MKLLDFLGTSLDDIRGFPEEVRHETGYQLHRVQCGEMPNDFKVMPSIGSGVVEIRIADRQGIFRVVYTAKIGDTVYVLHAFQKKTQKTAKSDIDLAKKRLNDLLKG